MRKHAPVTVPLSTQIATKESITIKKLVHANAHIKLNALRIKNLMKRLVPVNASISKNVLRVRFSKQNLQM